MFKKLAHLFVATILSLMVVLPSLAPAATALGTNLIANPSVEIASGSLPASWNQDKWGTNTAAFSYKTTEGYNSTKSLYLSMTARTSGDAKWTFPAVTAKAGTSYTYSEAYKSNVATEIDIEYTDTAGKLSYVWLGDTAASATAWATKGYTFTTPAKVKSMSIFHVISKVGWLQTDNFSLAETNAGTPTAPNVTLTAPVANATIANTATLSATATDAIGVAGVQFKVDGVAAGAEDVAAPFTTAWNSKSVANGAHTITATARNTSGLTSVATNTVTVQNIVATAPTVSITSPVNASTVSGAAVNLTASATDTIGMAGVQFKIDGANVGTEDVTSPYASVWNSTTATNGSHTLTATARNTSGLTSVATNTFTVQNVSVPPVTGTNLIANPSFETSQNTTTPDGWVSSNWGTNTSVFSYLPTGHTGSHSARAEVTAYTNGAANWYYANAPVTSGKSYKYENWYQSNVDTEVDAAVTMADGTTQYYWLGTVFANTAWTKYSTTFMAPAGAKSIAIYQILAKKGYLNTDDYSLSEYTPVPLSRGLVSVTFDDGWANQYTNAFPLLTKYGIPSTFYIISGELTDQPDYVSAAQVKNLYAAGNEIGSHSVTHPDLTTVTQAQLVQEMSQSKTTLQNLLGVPITNFAYPFGAYNQNTLTLGSQYYRSQRSVGGGLNTKDNFNITTLKIQEVDSNISQAQVQGWIDAANAQKAWLILVFHEVANTPTDPTDALYTTKPSDLDAELAYLKQSGVTVKTVEQALNEITPQL